MKDKLDHLLMIKEYMDEDMFRLTAASILVQHYLELMNKQSKVMMRSNLLDRVNLTLRSIGCSEVSYGFMRSWC